MNIIKGIDWFRGGDTMENLTAKILTASTERMKLAGVLMAQVKRHKRQPLSLRSFLICL